MRLFFSLTALTLFALAPVSANDYKSVVTGESGHVLASSSAPGIVVSLEVCASMEAPLPVSNMSITREGSEKYASATVAKASCSIITGTRIWVKKDVDAKGAQFRYLTTMGIN